MQRRFEFIGGGSAKFWAVTVHAATVTVRFGRIGTDGQRNQKSFASETAARRHAETLVRQKLAKGYLEQPA